MDWNVLIICVTVIVCTLMTGATVLSVFDKYCQYKRYSLAELIKSQAKKNSDE